MENKDRTKITDLKRKIDLQKAIEMEKAKCLLYRLA